MAGVGSDVLAINTMPTKTDLSLLLSAPISPDSAYHSMFWFCSSFVLWVVLHIYITPIYARVADILHAVWKLIRRNKNTSTNGTVFSELSWGSRFTQAYGRLSTSKRAYWRRLFRSFIYYFFAVIFGFYFLLSYFRTIVDLYLVYTPSMDIAFCFAASHFLWCCFEDYPCRAHMGKSKCEQLAVFWGYIVHHIVTAGAYLMAVHTREFASMCLMGLTFEGPVFFGCLREIVSLYDEDFNLFDRVPPILLKINWICAFVSLVPCRYVSIGFFWYSAINWRFYLELVSPTVRTCYWVFGSTFFFINIYFTWLLKYWYGQDQRYLKKKRRGAAVALQEQSTKLLPTTDQLSPIMPNSTASSPNQSPLASSPHPMQRHAAASVYPQPIESQTNVQIVTHKP